MSCMRWIDQDNQYNYDTRTRQSYSLEGVSRHLMLPMLCELRQKTEQHQTLSLGLKNMEKRTFFTNFLILYLD